MSVCVHLRACTRVCSSLRACVRAHEYVRATCVHACACTWMCARACVRANAVHACVRVLSSYTPPPCWWPTCCRTRSPLDGAAVCVAAGWSHRASSTSWRGRAGNHSPPSSHRPSPLSSPRSSPPPSRPRSTSYRSTDTNSDHINDRAQRATKSDKDGRKETTVVKYQPN